MKRIAAGLFFVFTALMIFTFRGYAEFDGTEKLQLYLNELTSVPVDNPTRIAISNPTIVDIGTMNAEELTLIPKAVGKTTLTLWDREGEHAYKIYVYEENLKEVKAQIDNMLSVVNYPTVYTRISDGENKIFLVGQVKRSQDKERIATLLGPLLKDKIINLVEVKEEEAIVDIDVQVLELNRDATRTLGFTWPGSINFTEVGSAGIASAGTTWGKVFSGGRVTRSIGETPNPFSLTLDALVQEGKAKILSRPRLSCQSGKEAELTVGGEKPIFTTQIAGTTGNQGTSVEYKEFGIKLKIKPTLTDEERIKLAVNIEVSDVGTAETIGTTSGSTTTVTAKAYPLSKRTAITELYLNNGQTMIIGGLIKKKDEEDISRTPGLGDIPVLGAFFRKRINRQGGGAGERGQTELFITISPKVVTPEVPDKTGSKVIQKSSDNMAAVAQKDINLDLLSAKDRAVFNYSKIIQARISENLKYPPDLFNSGIEGRLKLGLHISYSGKLLGVLVKEHSDSGEIDKYVTSVAKSITSYPPFPPSINQDDIWVDIPIIYKTN